MRQVLFAAILLFGSLGSPQECTTSVVVNVFDDRLHIDIQTLTAEDFQARMGGTPITVISSEQGYDSRLLVLVETDGIAKNERLSDIVDTVTRMARQAPAGKPVAFGMYAEKAVFTEDFISDPKKRGAAISGIAEQATSLGKRVALFDALYRGLRLFGEHQPGDTILLVGSPYDDRSSHSLAEVKKEFLSSGTRFMAMLRRPMSRVGPPDFIVNSHEPEKSLFLDFAERTGGAHSDFDPHFFGFAWRGYKLLVKVPKHVRKPHDWSLRVRGLTDGFFKHTVVFYPELLQPCQVAESTGPN
jgi:hypothetical protein